MVQSEKTTIEPDLFKNKVLIRNAEKGRSACEIMAAAINAVDPYLCVSQFIKNTNAGLIIGDELVLLSDVDRVFITGFGKASVPMAKALLDIFEGEVELAEVVTKSIDFLAESGYWDKLAVHIGNHPIPGKDSIHSTRIILEKLPALTNRDLVFVVISGGGSALFTDPISGITLEDVKDMTQVLLKSGADISEINTLRKHFDGVKGGRYGLRLKPAKVRTLILSDVIGDQLDMIASGPTVADPTTFSDIEKIIDKYQLWDSLPKSVINALHKGLHGELEETMKANNLEALDLQNCMVGTNIKAARAAKEKAQNLGYHSVIVTTHLSGLTKDVSKFLKSIIETEIEYDHPVEKPACLIFGGETTVQVMGNGMGGRNQDLALHMVKKLFDQDKVLFISLGTDGEDGPTNAAGAAVDSKVYSDGEELLGKNIDRYIEGNDSYHYFRELGALIEIGPTGTNVNDLILILIDF